MLDLASRIDAALKDSKTHPWLSHLTGELVGIGWEALARTAGLTPASYGTVRVARGDAGVSREVLTYLPELLDARDGGIGMGIELLPDQFASRKAGRAVTFYTAAEICNTQVLRCIEEAVGIIAMVPTLATTVTALVRSVHLLKLEDDDYDVSFSDPKIPFSIFVSVPRHRVQADVIRVAESILHEAMHLQLTLIERLLPLVHRSHAKYFSPWRGEPRTPQGVLHALYVFRVVDAFFAELTSRESTNTAWSNFAQERRSQIHRQLNEVSAFHECPDLTLCGSSFVRRLLAQHIEKHPATLKWPERVNAKL